MDIMPMHIGLIWTDRRLKTYRKQRVVLAVCVYPTTIRHFEHDSNFRATDYAVVALGLPGCRRRTIGVVAVDMAKCFSRSRLATHMPYALILLALCRQYFHGNPLIFRERR